MAKIYVASSWRNSKQDKVVTDLRLNGHEVYDFKNPGPGLRGFAWSELDPEYKTWTMSQYRMALQSPIAAQGFMNDFRAMRWADACVLVLPCGRSAHTELGYFAGVGKRSIILLDEEKFEPELMYLQADHLCINFKEVIQALK